MYVYGDWWFCKNDFESYKWPTQFFVPDDVPRGRTLHDRMCKAAIPVATEKCVMSQWKQVSDVARFAADLEPIWP